MCWKRVRPGFGDENVHIIDPFTGTARLSRAFAERLLIDKKDMLRNTSMKYMPMKSFCSPTILPL